MLKLRKPLLPEWRYWPAIALVALFLLPLAGSSIAPIPQPQPAPYPIGIIQPGHETAKDVRIETADDRIANYTALLAWFTCGLLGVAGLQVWLLFKADKTARMNAELVEKQVAIAAAQTDILIKQKEISRQQFAAAHRPKLIVRRISLDKFGANEHATVQYIVANVGDTPGRIVESNATIRIYRAGGRTPQIPEYSDETSSMGNLTVSPGPGLPLKVDSIYRITEELWDAVYPTPSEVGGAMYVIGYIVYRGADDVLRHYTFGRKFDPSSTRFAIMNDPNYEYGD